MANTTFYCEDSHQVLQAMALVELAKQGWVESVPLQSRCWPALVHQLLAMALQFGGVTPDDCWEQASRVTDFRGISRPEFDGLVAFLLSEGFLFEAGGLLSFGEKAEKVFGRRNFMEMYAVFSSPMLYRVATLARQAIGSIEQDFVDRQVEGMSSFLLAGRAWVVEKVVHADRMVLVRPAPRGKKPSWGGFVPQMLSRELCASIRRVLESVSFRQACVSRGTPLGYGASPVTMTRRMAHGSRETGRREAQAVAASD